MGSLRDSLTAAVQGGWSDSIIQSQYQQGTTTTTNAQAAAEARKVVKQRSFTWSFTDGGTAATAVGETVIFAVDSNLSTGIKVLAVNVAFPVGVTANNSTYATITVAKRTSGGASSTVAQNTTQVTDTVLGANATAFKFYPMTLTAANVALTQGTDVLTLTVAKASTGVALGSATAACSITVVYEES